MALIACSNPRRRKSYRFSLCLLFGLSLAATAAAQTATYRLHREASTTANLFQLMPANPDGAVLAIASQNLKNVANGEYVIKQFDTQSDVPNASGTIAAGSTITFALWLRKTSTSGTMFPRAKLNLNSAAGTLLGTATSETALTNTLTKYTFTTTTSANIAMTAADRFYLWVGVNVTAKPTTNTNAELDIEGIVDGNYDSFIVAPLPVSVPTISNISPAVGPVGTSVTITGSGFGATQGTSTVAFNSVTGAPTNWSNTSIVCPVPAGATTGPVVVTVGGTASNGSTFTVAETGTITGTVSRASDAAGINGALIEALQSGIVKASATSGDNGSYSIAGLISGTYDVRASAARYTTQVQIGAVVSAPSSTSVNFSLVDVGPITNIYDELGRLVAVIDPGGETVTYRYDSVGNLQSISRSSSSQLSIIEFSPDKGPIGASVTIYGTAFSQTPAENIVKFNGTNATVSASTSTQISTTVPAGTTSGLITVTTPSGTATSNTPFTVGSDAPVITSFTPNIGAAGTTVNISGSNFDSTTSGNRVAFNGTRSIVTAATSTALTTTVPAGATSGRISDTTPAGTGASSDYFFIPPPPLTAADVEVFSYMAIGETKTITIATANKVAMVLFDGTAGQRVCLKMTGVTISSGFVYIYKPDGSTLSSASVNTSGGFIDTQTLPMDGTYTILVDPSSTNTGSMTLNLYAVADVIATITPGGPPVTVTTTVSGQNALLTFDGTAAQRISLKMTGVTIGTSTCCSSRVSILNPDGTALVSPTFVGTSGGFFDTQTLSVSGVYTILVDPQSSDTGSMTLTLYDVPPDVTTSITPGGSPVTVTTTVPGQNAKSTFNATIGQRISLRMTGVTIGTSTCCSSRVSILNPDGTALVSPTFVGTSGGFFDTQTLSASGVYSILVDPQSSDTGSMTLTLNDVPQDTTGTIMPGGPPVTVTTTVSGQNALLTFDGTAAQRISLKMTGVTIGTSTCCSSRVSILNPDGTALVSPTFVGTSGGFFDTQTLSVSGVYTILVDPQSSDTGSMTLTLYDVPPDVTTSITPGGSPVTVTTTVPGQNAKSTFNATIGQRISLRMTGVTIGTSTCCSSRVSILNPDGSALVSPTFVGTSGGFFDTQTLSASGVYSILVDPQSSDTGSMTLTLNDVPQDTTGTIMPGGPPVTVTTTVSGQNALLTFDGTAAQRISLKMTGVTIGTSTCCSSRVSILNPDGTALVSPTFVGTSGGFFDTQTLSVSGVYTILVDPQSSDTGSMTLTLYDVPPDVTTSITPGGSPVTVTTTVPGQNAKSTFNATIGQRISLRMTGVTIGTSTCCSSRVSILNPDGSALVSPTFVGTSGGFFDTQTLSASGVYSILVDPQSSDTGSMTLDLYDVPADVGGTITLGGPAVDVSITVPGQNASLTFSGTAGQQATVRVSGSTMSCVRVTLLKPDGSSLTTTFTCSGTFNLATQTLPVTGTYTITVDPSGANTGSMSLSVTNP